MEKEMKLTLGNYANYLRVKEFKEEYKPIKTKDLGMGIYVDYSSDGELLGIEILGKLNINYYDDYKKIDK